MYQYPGFGHTRTVPYVYSWKRYLLIWDKVKRSTSAVRCYTTVSTAATHSLRCRVRGIRANHSLATGFLQQRLDLLIKPCVVTRIASWHKLVAQARVTSQYG